MSNLKKEAKARNQAVQSSSNTPKQNEKETGLVRWLRSQNPQQKSAQPEPEANNSTPAVVQKHKKGLKPKNVSAKDDSARIKMRVRYLINIIKREQSLIDAYSADGWQGRSLEKIRPEQELKKAETRILQSKFKIREELQKLHKLSLEGSIEENAFEPDGQIYFDDIFCAVCRSKELHPENDIILCDGACNRAFHQYCLDPPLRTEDIPPGDDGWLCPVCDSKFDCLDAINDNFGTDFKIEDSWEKVFEEVEDASACDKLTGSQVDWPSEDSEDDDYEPEVRKPSTGEPGQEDGSAAEEVSDSDADSDSDSDSSDSGSEVEFFDEFAGLARGKKGSFYEDDEDDNENGEMTLEQAEIDDAVVVTGKRQRADVDYKQLYDEAYGAGASDYESSEDEDWGKAKQFKGSPDSSDRTASRSQKRLSTQDSKDVRPRGRKSSISLSEEVVMRLQEEFQRSELPSKACKHALSKELGVSYDEVNIWFRNARSASNRKKKLKNGTEFSELATEDMAKGRREIKITMATNAQATDPQ
ncbi:hypothetical protein KP509_21G036500 [Ceratopteris richardii]|uniref:Pathogenesis-related homeodomain protein n=1 Tax=Ceratopteris richardii TaxID=49495 RepID=A0A8T2S9C4_CERRI|nr:hypothetical protein KP509_21G036500 [Ceratopteris richardii]KAH7315158.1 hypothetical protein KP509_21G036500 [Ceratopteris richardii]